MIKRSYRVPDWKQYNENLVRRGSITLWISEEVAKDWYEAPKGRRGRPKKYSDKAIECGLTIKALFRLPFRMTEGFLKSLKELLKLEIDIPDYTLLCKRQKAVQVALPRSVKSGEGLHLVVDTTGIKVYGEGEWKVRQHGWVKHRLWRKLHLAINSKTQEIEAFELTDLGIQDCEGLGMLLNKVVDKVEKVIGDGAYDRFSCYEEGEKRQFKMLAPPQRNAKTSKERMSYKRKIDPEALKKRDQAIEGARTLGRKDWKISEGYHRRSLAETAMHRVKGILGNKLSSRKLEHQKTEIAIRCRIINEMTRLGMPQAIPA
jgi:IS5 family transposase